MCPAHSGCSTRYNAAPMPAGEQQCIVPSRWHAPIVALGALKGSLAEIGLEGRVCEGGRACDAMRRRVEEQSAFKRRS